MEEEIFSQHSQIIKLNWNLLLPEKIECVMHAESLLYDFEAKSIISINAEVNFFTIAFQVTQELILGTTNI